VATKQTWVCEYDSIENTELDDIDVDFTHVLDKLQQTRDQLSIPAYVNTLLWGH